MFGKLFRLVIIIFVIITFYDGCQKNDYLLPNCSEFDNDPDFWVFSESSIRFSELTTMHQSMVFYNGIGLFVVPSSDELICDIYDSRSKSRISSITLPTFDYPIPHANTTCFGTLYDSESSDFPLLYVSSWNGSKMAFVYDIVRDKTNNQNAFFMPRLVQVIDPSSLSEEYVGLGALDWVVDVEDSSIYSVSYKLNDSATIIDGNASFINKYNLPSIETSYVALTDDDVIDHFEIPIMNVSQDKLIYNKHIYVVAGMPDKSGLFPNQIYDVDLNTKTLSGQFLSLRGEPEGFCIYRGKLLLNMNSSPIINILNYSF